MRLAQGSRDNLLPLDDLVSSHADLAQQLFGDVPDDRLVAFAEVLEETTNRFARPMVEET